MTPTHKETKNRRSQLEVRQEGRRSRMKILSFQASVPDNRVKPRPVKLVAVLVQLGIEVVPPETV